MSFFIQLALITLLSISLYGETGNIIVLNREKVISLAKKRSSILAQSDLVLIRNQEKVKLSKFWQSGPSLELEGGYRFSNNENDRGIYLKQELDRSQKNRLTLAKSALALTKKDIALIKREVIAQSLTKYIEALYAMNLKQIARDNVTHYEEILKISKLLKSAGEIGEMDLSISEITLGKSRSILARRKANFSVKIAQLRSHLALPNYIEIKLSGELEWNLPETNPVVKSNIENHPLIDYHRTAVEKAKATYELTRSDYKSKLELGAGYENEDGENKALLSLGIQFGPSGKSHAMKVANSKILEAELKLDQIKKDLFIKVEAAWSNYQLLKVALEAYNEETLLNLQKNETLVEKRFKTGDLPLTNLLNIQREMLETKEEFINLKYDVVISAIELARVACFKPFLSVNNN